MKLFINGKEETFNGLGTLHDLIVSKNLPEQRIIVEVNGNLIKRDEWERTALQEADRIEILRFVGGG
ncbi:MAG: sulfur carrier protein ThiS [Firmicutes bacterium]|nr:sulfur carrier protein ThiS [Bacillota bacterium]